MAHLGHPYEGECIAAFRKHPNVYADVSALHYRPFQLYHSPDAGAEVRRLGQGAVRNGFPLYDTVNESITGIRRLNKMTTGTGLPRLDEAQVEQMIHRDSLEALGLEESAK